MITRKQLLAGEWVALVAVVACMANALLADGGVEGARSMPELSDASCASRLLNGSVHHDHDDDDDLDAATRNEQRVPRLDASRGGQDRVGADWPTMQFDFWPHDGVADHHNYARDSHDEHRPLPTKDRVTLYRWWTDGCGFCARSLPAMQELAQEFADDGLQVVAVYHPKPPRDRVNMDRVRRSAAQIGYRGLIAVDLDWSAYRRAWSDSRPRRATSVSFLVDDRGVIRFVHPGPVLHPSDEPRHRQEDADYRALRRAIEIVLAEAAERNAADEASREAAMDRQGFGISSEND